MAEFEFSSEVVPFKGNEFYNVYKDAEFLHSSHNINRLLQQGYELRRELKKKSPGESIILKDMWITTSAPLIVKKTGPGVKIEEFEFTHNRLTGLAAAYAYDNRHKLPILQAEEAKILHLIWNHEDAVGSKLYLSSVSGSEHFDEQFSFWPLLCALRKLQLGKIDEKTVIKIAKKKNSDGARKASRLKLNFAEAKRIWCLFPGAPSLEHTISSFTSKQLRDVLND